MSGHSKWATIKRQKGVNDAKRGQIFTKLSKAISIAVRQGGGDLGSNPRLRLAIDTAKSYNMPKENVDRAIKRALGKDEKDLNDVIYEGFGPGGFSLIIEVITDNKQRTTPEIKNRVEKLGGIFGSPGSVSYQFEQKGMLVIAGSEKNADELFLIAAESGAEDIERNEEDFIIYTKHNDLTKVRDKLINNSLIVKSAEFIWVPNTFIKLNDLDSLNKAIHFIEELEDMEDVQKVYTNLDLSDDLERELI